MITNARIEPQKAATDYHKQGVSRGHPDYVMSYSAIKQFLPCHSRWLNGYEVERSTELDVGAVVDCLLLTPEEFDSRFAVCPETYTNKNGEQSAWKNDRRIAEVAAWLDSNAGKSIIKSSLLAEAKEMANRALVDFEFASYVRNSKTQAQLAAEFETKRGIKIPLRGMVDLVPDVAHPRFGKSLGDLKCYQSAHPRSWSRSVFDHGLDIQAALYLDMWTAATGEDRCEFRHLIIEQQFPYQTGRRILSQEFLEAGRAKYRHALNLYAACLESGIWPDYETGNEVIEGWSITQPEAYML